MKIDEKRKIVEDLHERFLRSSIVIVTDCKGLDVITLNNLRSKLRNVKVEYRVVKNSLLIRAAEGTDVALIKDSFKGPSAVALSYDDQVAPAKVLSGFTDDHDKFGIKIGVMNGKALDLSAIKALATLPSHKVLLGQLLSAMNGIPSAFVRTLSDLPKRLLNLLQAVKEQKEASG